MRIRDPGPIKMLYLSDVLRDFKKHTSQNIIQTSEETRWKPAETGGFHFTDNISEVQKSTYRDHRWIRTKDRLDEQNSCRQQNRRMKHLRLLMRLFEAISC